MARRKKAMTADYPIKSPRNMIQMTNADMYQNAHNQGIATNSFSYAVNRHYRDVKQALRKGLLVNGFNLGKYGFSPYAACGHACTYCDGRAEKYFVEGDFGTDIVVRKNLPEVLDTELANLREPGIVSIGSGISDPYQPVEADEHIMERCARLIANHGYAATLLTKSALILRDIDIWKEVHAKRGFILMLSLVFTDDTERSIFEPAASSVEKRLEVVRAFRAAGIPVCILAMPLLPYIADTDEKASKLFSTLADLGVNCIVPGGLTLRPGRQKETYLDVISQHYPHLRAEYRKLYREARPSGACLAFYSKDVMQRMGRLLAPMNIPLGLPHNLYKNLLPIYDEVLVLMGHMEYLYANRGISVAALRSSRAKYADWLKNEKKSFNRKRSMPYRALEAKLRDMAETNGLMNVIANEKLARFLRQIIIEEKTFSYLTLKLNEGCSA